jgi:Peptidase family M49
MISRRFALTLLLMTTTTNSAFPDELSLGRMAARFHPAEIKADTAPLTLGDRKALAKLVAAAHIIDRIYMEQLWSGDLALYHKLQQDHSALGKARLAYFEINKGPWSDLDGHQAFLPGVLPERKPLGANFYPEDMTRQEFEAWPKKDIGFFSVIRREPRSKGLVAIPYSRAYATELTQAAHLLEQAASETTNASLKKFLTLRAKAFLTDDYYASDVAWMDLDSPVDVTIGPYETYTDELFGYKAAFEAYISIRDDVESKKLKFFAGHLQEIENNLPVDAKYRNPKIGAASPITVVNQIISAGDGGHGVMTAAYNLPNDERIVRERGTKQVMMKNVQEAKFSNVLIPISRRVLNAKDQEDLSFEWFFTHILAHELSHGIGPHENVRQSLKELYSALEEAKADVTGLYLLQYMFDHNQLPRQEHKLYTTYLASMFRSLRFGTVEAHGRGTALQLNYLMDHGAVKLGADGRFAIDFGRIQQAVRDLSHEILTIEAEGNYAAARKLLDDMAVVRPDVQKALNGLSDLPVDILPNNVTAAAMEH